MSIDPNPSLSEEHRRELHDGSGISEANIAARGYVTATKSAEVLAAGFGTTVAKRVPGLLVPTISASGDVVAYQYKPDRPRKDKASKGKFVKYETPKGSRVHLNVPPAAAADLSNTEVALWITEGAKKADAAVTAGLCCLSLQGVDSWRNGDGPLPEWEGIALSGREVFVAFDSDAMRKPSVRAALDALTSFLRAQNARVRWVTMPEPGSLAGEARKVGLDDWLVAHEMNPNGLMQFVVQPPVAIKVNGLSLPEITRQAIAALDARNTPPTLFQRDGELIEAQGIGAVLVESGRLRYLLGESAEWFNLAQRGDAVVRKPVYPPKDVVTNVAAAGPDQWRFPRLDRIVTTPVFSKKGTLRVEPGYHEDSRSLYLPPEGLVIPRVERSPAKKDVKKAKALINEMLADFVFVDDSDRAHAYALLLQPFARQIIRGHVPLFVVQAPKQGTGKTLLVQSCLAPAVGEVDSFSEPHGDEEMEKRLTSAIKEAHPALFFDNVTRFVSYPSLATALTKSTWSGRVLGKSATVTMPINQTFVMTANNPQFSDDMRRRVVPIRLDARVEDPSQRTGFALSLPSWALERRGELVWAACTLIAFWVAAGRPAPSADTPSLGSYGPWRRVVGGVLDHVGVEGFLRNLDAVRQDKSPEQETFETVAGQAIKRMGAGEWWFHKDLAEDLWSQDVELQFGKPWRTTEDLADRLTYHLRDHRGQVVRGFVLEREDKRKSRGYRWRFVRQEA